MIFCSTNQGGKISKWEDIHEIFSPVGAHVTIFSPEMLVSFPVLLLSELCEQQLPSILIQISPLQRYCPFVFAMKLSV